MKTNDTPIIPGNHSEFTMAMHSGKRLNRAAVPFELADTNGETRRLAEFAGRWLLVVFHRHLA